MSIKTHKELNVWKLSIALVTDIYQFSRKLPKHEQFGLISQVQRAAVSVPVNIAEGSARNSTKEYIRFLYISLGSCSELDTLMIIATNIYQEDTGYLRQQIETISKMLVAMIAALKKRLIDTQVPAH